jgi:CBS domain-containing protein
MSVGTLCVREVVTATRDATITEVAAIMRAQHVGSVVVVEEMESRQVPVGIVTDRDIVVEAVATSLDADTITSGDIMTPSPLIVKEEDDASDTVQIMCLHGVRRAPVISAAGSLIGVLSVNDLLVKYAEDMGVLSTLSARQRRRERSERRWGRVAMPRAVQVTMRRAAQSALSEKIRKRVSRLEHLCHDALSCRVAIDPVQGAGHMARSSAGECGSMFRGPRCSPARKAKTLRPRCATCLMW